MANTENSTVAQIDEAIDAIRAKLIARTGPFDEMDAGAWQAAWDAHPDLRSAETSLFRDRWAAQHAIDNPPTQRRRRA